MITGLGARARAGRETELGGDLCIGYLFHIADSVEQGIKEATPFFEENSKMFAPLGIAWDAFGPKNGAPSYPEMCRRIEKYRRAPVGPHAQYTIGCIILQEPFFFCERDWIPAPGDFNRNIVQGTTYDLGFDILRESDGPMLQHGLQSFQGGRIHTPRPKQLWPRADLLAERYEAFRKAG